MFFSNIDRSLKRYPAKFTHTVPEILQPDGIYEITLVRVEMIPSPCGDRDVFPHFIFYEPSTQIAIEINRNLILPNLILPKLKIDTFRMLPLAEIELFNELLSWFVEFDKTGEVDLYKTNYNTVLSFEAKLINPQIALPLSKLLCQTRLLNQQKLDIENDLTSFIYSPTN